MISPVVTSSTRPHKTSSLGSYSKSLTWATTPSRIHQRLSGRLVVPLADELGVGVPGSHGVRDLPHRAAKVRAERDHAVCGWETSGQALDRTAPMLPPRPGLPRGSSSSQSTFHALQVMQPGALLHLWDDCDQPTRRARWPERASRGWPGHHRPAWPTTVPRRSEASLSVVRSQTEKLPDYITLSDVEDYMICTTWIVVDMRSGSRKNLVAYLILTT